MGYPVTLGFNYDHLYPFFKYFINNIGDPFVEGSYRIEVKKIERDVISFFRKLFHLPKNDYWGYVTAGGTEGNLFGLFLGRERFPKGIIYCSKDSHYSAFKIARILNIPIRKVASQANGEIDYMDFKRQLKNGKKYPPIILANISTTMKGASDDINKILTILKSQKIRNYHIHADAAFGGMVIPFLKGASVFDFRLPISSLSLSSYKIIGSPLVSGIVLTRKSLLHNSTQKKFIPYINTVDNTMLGSRSGLHSIILWSAIHEHGLKGFRRRANTAYRNNQWFLNKLHKIGWPAWQNSFSLITVIKKPTKRLLKKWMLSSQDDIAHLMVLPHTSRAMLQGFINDL